MLFQFFVNNDLLCLGIGEVIRKKITIKWTIIKDPDIDFLTPEITAESGSLLVPRRIRTRSWRFKNNKEFYYVTYNLIVLYKTFVVFFLWPTLHMYALSLYEKVLSIHCIFIFPRQPLTYRQYVIKCLK